MVNCVTSLTASRVPTLTRATCAGVTAPIDRKPARRAGPASNCADIARGDFWADWPGVANQGGTPPAVGVFGLVVVRDPPSKKMGGTPGVVGQRVADHPAGARLCHRQRQVL